MKNDEIKLILMDSLPLKEVHVSGDGSNFHIIAIGELFSGMSRIKKQQTIYMPLMKYIKDNHIHAISIKTYTIKEWEHDCTCNNNLVTINS